MDFIGVIEEAQASFFRLDNFQTLYVTSNSKVLKFT